MGRGIRAHLNKLGCRVTSCQAFDPSGERDSENNSWSCTLAPNIDQSLAPDLPLLGIRAITHTRSDPTSDLQPPSFVRPPPMPGGVGDQKQPTKKLEWDWDLEHQDRAQEAKADGAVHNAQPFLVDRRVLKDVVKDKFQIDVARIAFLTSGASYNSPQLPRSHFLCRYRRHVPQGISKFQPRH